MVTTSSAALLVLSVVQIVLNPSFELGTGTQATGWTLTNLGNTDVQSSDRFQVSANTESYSFRGVSVIEDGDFKPTDTRYIYDLSQTVTVIRGASYTVRVFARINDDGCDFAILLGGRVIRSLLFPTATYTAYSSVVTIVSTTPWQQALVVRTTCSGTYDGVDLGESFFDDVTMTLNA
jgi:hypothetical protein